MLVTPPQKNLVFMTVCTTSVQRERVKTGMGQRELSVPTGKIVFIRHGGQVLRVSPIHLRPVVDEPPHVPKNMKSKPQKSNRLYLSVQPSNEDVVQPNLSSDLLVDFDFDDLVLHILQT